MKEFRIGQRVRILKADVQPHLLGAVATVTSGLLADGRHRIEIDNHAGVWSVRPRNIEPIDEDKGDWRVIEHVTKWNPYKVNA